MGLLTFSKTEAGVALFAECRCRGPASLITMRTGALVLYWILDDAAQLDMDLHVCSV